MTKRRKSKKFKFNSFVLFVVVFIVLGSFVFNFISYSKQIYDKYKEKRQLDKQLTLLKEKEKELRLDANKLQDPDYVGRYAREKYFYSKDGEYIIKIPKEK